MNEADLSTGGAVSTPRPTGERIEILDVLRGVAVLGILAMNVVSFGLFDPAYFNITAGGGEGFVDRTVGIVAEIAVDQKMMGLFSALFGAGIVLFVDRVGQRRRHPVVLSVWRNIVLVVIGAIHVSFWDGDVLVLYGLCAPVVLLLRRLPVPALLAVGGTAMVVASLAGPVAQMIVNDSGGAGQLGWYWFDQDLDASDVVGGFVVADAAIRALGMMLIGVALYRTGVLTAARSDSWYRRAAVIGLGVGGALSVSGVVWLAATGHSWRHALAATAPNTAATAPMTIGIVSVVVLVWRRRPDRLTRLAPVGRMALTNYLTQTALGLVVLRGFVGRGELVRIELLIFTVAVWGVQVVWSTWWLSRFTQGPVEWAWRTATYVRWTPLRRRP